MSDFNETKAMVDILDVPMFTSQGVLLQRYWEVGHKQMPAVLEYRTVLQQKGSCKVTWWPYGTFTADVYSARLRKLIPKGTTYIMAQNCTLLAVIGDKIVPLSNSLYHKPSTDIAIRQHATRENLTYVSFLD